MHTKNRFNLIDEPWVPVVGIGQVSLKQLFSSFDYRALGGNAIEKIALTKLLLAIAQSACTPNGDEDWKEWGVNGLSKSCLAYLDRMYDRFWLYGDKPFLQMPKIALAQLKSFGAVLPEIATGNTTILNNSQIEKPLSDANKALLLVSLMGFAMGGKKTDNTVILTEGYQGKSKSGQAGPCLGKRGLMHSFLLSDYLLDTILINLFTKEDLDGKLTFYSEGLGIPPWEKMPEGEECPAAVSLRNSLMGKLIPLSRFCLLSERGLHYSEGIQHPDYEKGGIDPSTAVSFLSKSPKVLWVDPEKRPWRHLTALLNLSKDQFDCYQVKLCLSRARELSTKNIGIWSGGIQVSYNAGEQFTSGINDFVDSEILLPIEYLGKAWYEQLKLEMESLDHLSSILYKSVINFFKDQKVNGSKTAKGACNLFWQLCERHFRALLIACKSCEEAKSLRKTVFKHCVNRAYSQFCPKDTARQLDSWAKNRPNLNKYLSEQTKVSYE